MPPVAIGEVNDPAATVSLVEHAGGSAWLVHRHHRRSGREHVVRTTVTLALRVGLKINDEVIGAERDNR
jgi:hypothetical protein